MSVSRMSPAKLPSGGCVRAMHALARDVGGGAGFHRVACSR